MLMRLRYNVLGGHVHVRLFTRRLPTAVTWANCGSLTFDLQEWNTWVRDTYRSFAQVLEESDPEPRP